MPLIPNYEPHGPLTLCPCCGGTGPQFWDWICYSCSDDLASSSAFRKRADAAYEVADKHAMGTPERIRAGRLEWARIGLELRAAGKLPPLTCRTRELEEPTRWGVWAGSESGGAWTWNGSAEKGHMVGTRAEAEAYAVHMRRFAIGMGAIYTVKPYPSPAATDNTSAAAIRVHDDIRAESLARAYPPGTLPIAPAKVDPYAAHNEANARRINSLQSRIETLIAREAKLVRDLETVRGELAAARKERGLR